MDPTTLIISRLNSTMTETSWHGLKPLPYNKALALKLCAALFQILVHKECTAVCFFDWSKSRLNTDVINKFIQQLIIAMSTGNWFSLNSNTFLVCANFEFLNHVRNIVMPATMFL